MSAIERKARGSTNVKDRIGALDGTVTIASAPGRGTLVAGRVPLRA